MDQTFKPDGGDYTLRDAVHCFERNYIRNALAFHGGDKEKTARYLGIGLSSLYRKIRTLNIQYDGGTKPYAPHESTSLPTF